MRFRKGIFGLLALGLAVGQASAQGLEQTSFIFRRPARHCDTCAPASTPVTVVPHAPVEPKKQDPVEKKDQAPQVVDPGAFAQAPAAGGEGGATFNPTMFGDLVGGSFVTISVPGSGTGSSSRVRVPNASRGSFKIADNESPRPQDRVFLTYNHYHNVDINGRSIDINREVIGFEKTFLDGNASFGLRLPFLQFNNVGSFGAISDSQVGDLSLILKYAFLNDRDTGDVFSGGVVVTLPTADSSVRAIDGGDFDDVYLIQPYIGYIFNSDLFYVHAFHSLIIPTDDRDVTAMANDIGVGLWLYRGEEDSTIRGIVPTIEGHLYTPLDHRSRNDTIRGFDTFIVTGGVNFILPGNSTIGVGIATPLTGPRPFEWEGIASINFRF